MTKIRFFCLAASLALCACAQEAPLTGMDAYVTNIMAQWKLPGLALVVIKDGRIAHMQGYGVRRHGGDGGVDSNTIFAIGSCTKAFTATAVGLLKDEGRLGWDDCITNHLPWFATSSNEVTPVITIRDALAMRTGLSKNVCDYMWYGTDHSREEIVRRLRFAPFEHQFRTTFTYNNPMYVAAGEIIRAAGGKTWEQFVSERLLQPVGMTRSCATLSGLADFDGNIASPHIITSAKEVVPIEYFSLDNAGPCGSIHASPADMARWMQMHLAGGVAGTNRIIAQATLEETYAPVTPIDANGLERRAPRADTTRLGPGPSALDEGDARILDRPGMREASSYYCMGWACGEYDGHFYVAHAGGVNGMNGAYVALMPDIGLGVAILENGEWEHGIPINLHNALCYWICDRYLEKPVVDYNPYFLSDAQANMDNWVEYCRKVEEERVPGTSTTLPPYAYASCFTNTLFGDAQFYGQSNGLVCRLASRLVYDLEHWQYDMFRGVCRDTDYQLRMGHYFFNFNLGQGIVTNMDNYFFAFLPAAGASGDAPVPGDYDGNGATDLAAYKVETGGWAIRDILGGRLVSGTAWGGPAFAPVPGDFDGDGASDLCVYHEESGLWYIASLTSVQSSVSSIQTSESPDTDLSGIALSEVEWAKTEHPKPNTAERLAGTLALHGPLNTEHCTLNTAAPRVLAWAVPWGGPGFQPVPGDFDGDGASDMCMYHEESGLWFIASLTSVQYSVSSIQTSESPDTDLSGIALSEVEWAKTEHPKPNTAERLAGTLALHGPLNTEHCTLNTAAPRVIAWAVPWGGAGLAPVPGDFDGDGASDLCVYHEESGLWYIASLADESPGAGSKFKVQGSKLEAETPNTDHRTPITSSTPPSGNLAIAALAWAVPWGGPGLEPVPGDFDGDGASDLAVYSNTNGNWYACSATGALLFWAVPFGGPGLNPVPGDFDGDGAGDIAVYEANSGNWYIRTAAGQIIVWSQNWGL